ncbi:drug/metabolite transporter (DMT)-like permease [Parabacteroides sp. PF5-5]|uniref:DMT family transporter n=1 Tax=unclassified Parabacteroides TaxID=2649774 RepID=UPI002473228B|nr:MULTISPECIES: DMT family transporter [unclassified Parabacteroides]MDH6306680.1 drug/metabolite transporter (DMT)-like permease [Parabacteroides sp. PH5-39]MDH6317924.1 drug/metabolite transporter (DMT)-like permease [Parabacteroides sp. PF5-13]MDH6321468.1 drug/metabolite transporter (DMT)-like permease [Parabacteroides sp. PH5-13]MDH6325199.1 drug/metabolite transporter (DMT)-like permease [Parabacteroides sp. PH5-8]MDH6329043.1 drug/metabolite transporter (DMT)-like permease [Parabactero
MSPKFKGLIFGIIAAIAYGSNPLFSLPLYAEGMTPDSVLFYRFGIGSLLFGIVLRLKGESLKIKKKEILPLFILGVLFALSSLLLFKSFLYMDAGVASTILFIYPVLVAVVMAVFFKEKASWLTYGCIALALIGIVLLYKGDDNTTLNTTGMILVALSALMYAIYIVAVEHSAVSAMSPGKMTFWIILFGTSVFIVSTGFMTGLQSIPPTMSGWINILGVAIVPTIISIMFINISIKYIGATYAAIIGALDPVTALLIGVLVFYEAFTFRIAMGAFLIVIAVTLVVSGNTIIAGFKRRVTTKWSKG